MEFAEAFAGQELLTRDGVIALMRQFTQHCLGRTARHLGVSREQAQVITGLGNLTGAGSYRQPSFGQIGGLTPIYKQFKPTSDIFDRAMLGTEPTGGNDWLAGLRIHTDAVGEGNYRVTAMYAGLLRWGNTGIDIQQRMVAAATAATTDAGFDNFVELPWAELHDHMWGVAWRPEQAEGESDGDLVAAVSWLLATLVPVLRERRPGTAAPAVILHPRFIQVNGRVGDGAYFNPPVKGEYQFDFRAHEARVLRRFGRELSGIALGRPVRINVRGSFQYSTSCSGAFSTIRELGVALGLQHGDHARMEAQPDGTWVIEAGKPPSMLINRLDMIGPGRPLDGESVLATFQRYLADHPAAWFGVRTLNRLRRSRTQEFQSAIQREIPVCVFVCDRTGEVACVMRVLGVESQSEPVGAPGWELSPELAELGPSRIWLSLGEPEPASFGLEELVQEDTGRPVAPSPPDIVTFVYRERGSLLAQPELELLGCSGEIDQYVGDMQRITADHGAAMYFWTFGIRTSYRDRLQQGPFWLNIYMSGGRREITHRCRVLEVHTTDDTAGIPSPDVALTPDEDRDRLERTWLKVADFEELLEPIPLADFVAYDSGDPIVPQALISAFAYVRRRPAMVSGPEAEGEGGSDQVRPLAEILHAFASSGELVYEPADIINLHYALNTLPHKHFVILHGVSGTGKSQIAQGYTNALYGRQPLTEPGNPYYRIVSVQPTWQDRTPLLGYYNPLTETYEQPPFLQHLLNADKDRGHQYVICLDEMNLAVVEHYFADFLSAWESREAIPLHHHSGKVADVPETVTVPPNVLIIGTVNVDETTHGFSPKVLDRAFTVELTHVDLRAHGKRFMGRCETEDERELVSRAVDLLAQVHAILSPNGLHFAYRTANEILSFLLTNAGGSHALAESVALDLMLCQKVLPKLRGDDRLLPMLEALITLLEQQPWGATARCRTMVMRMKADADRFGTFQYWR